MQIFEGTSTELMQQAITLNGELLDSVGFSILLRYKLIEVIGERTKEEFSRKRGRTPKIFRLVSKEGLVFSKEQELI
jgi:hypothetical protein